jgi:GTPase SAR1 family protein
MARLIVVIGDSGTGKTTSLKGLKKEEVNLISPTGKEMPFRSDIKVVKTDLENLPSLALKAPAPMVIIDDTNQFFTLYQGKHALDKDQFLVFKTIANTFNQLVEKIVSKETDQNYYVFAHIDREDNGRRKFKTTGKFIGDNLQPESLTNVVLEAIYDDTEGEIKDRYKFAVHKMESSSPVKTPEDMFEDDMIPNKLKLVDDTIREYYKPAPATKTTKEKK